MEFPKAQPLQMRSQLMTTARGIHPDGLKVKALAPVGTDPAIQVDSVFSAKWTKNRLYGKVKPSCLKSRVFGNFGGEVPQTFFWEVHTGAIQSFRNFRPKR
jgi:hypothetical protein